MCIDLIRILNVAHPLHLNRPAIGNVIVMCIYTSNLITMTLIIMIFIGFNGRPSIELLIERESEKKFSLFFFFFAFFHSLCVCFFIFHEMFF